MQKCRYVECERVEKVNEEGACSGCEALVARTRDRIERGRLPKIAGQEGKTPRTTALKLTQGGMPCAACDETIAAEHFAYPDYPVPAGARKADLHMHFLCHEIWEEEATVTD